MQQFFSSRAFKLTILTLVLTVAFLLIINLIFLAIGWSLPFGLQLVLCLLGAGYLVYQFFADHLY